MLNPDLPIVSIPCSPFGRPTVLVLVLPRAASSLLAAIWRWPDGTVRDATIGRA